MVSAVLPALLKLLLLLELLLFPTLLLVVVFFPFPLLPLSVAPAVFPQGATRNP